MFGKVATVFILFNILNGGCSLPAASESYSVQYYDKIIDDVKNAGARWEAGHNFKENEEFKHLISFLDPINDKDMQKPNQTCIHTNMNEGGDAKVGYAPESRSFNGLIEWKHCKSVRRVWNQGRCASDWVIAPTSAFTDRLCIASNGTFQETISPQIPLACCKTCGWGCKRGYPSEVNEYLVKRGSVTGGEHGSDEGCQPYSIWPSKHAKYFQRAYEATPKCQRQCTNSEYKKTFYQDLYKAKRAFSFGCPCGAIYELKTHGPIVATMVVYEDFITYKSGVYRHVSGKPLGKLTVKLVGYSDEDPEERYWIAVNSWGKKWGENGRFKIRRGAGECMIEGSMHGVYVYGNTDVSDSDSGFDES